MVRKSDLSPTAWEAKGQIIDSLRKNSCNSHSREEYDAIAYRTLLKLCGEARRVSEQSLSKCSVAFVAAGIGKEVADKLIAEVRRSAVA